MFSTLLPSLSSTSNGKILILVVFVSSLFMLFIVNVIFRVVILLIILLYFYSLYLFYYFFIDLLLYFNITFNPGPMVVERVIFFRKSLFQPAGFNSIILLYKVLYFSSNCW